MLYTRSALFILLFLMPFTWAAWPLGSPPAEPEPMGVSFSGIAALSSLGLPSAMLAAFTERYPHFAGKSACGIVTLIDFSLPSHVKRLWTVDLDTGTLLFHTWVAHGRNSGDRMATCFSNIPESYQSSLGFYLSANDYQGKHGLSLRLEGLEPGINCKAMDRAIVIHGADYVSEAFIQAQGRLGRSHGCPAVPLEEAAPLIETIKEGSLVFVWHPEYGGQGGGAERGCTKYKDLRATVICN
jgi:hypothetical protein